MSEQMTKTKKKARGITLSTYLPADVAEDLRARARAADRTVAAELRRALREYLANDEHREAAA